MQMNLLNQEKRGWQPNLSIKDKKLQMNNYVHPGFLLEINFVFCACICQSFYAIIGLSCNCFCVVYMKYGLHEVWFTRSVVYTKCGLHEVWFTRSVVYTKCGLHEVWFTRIVIYTNCKPRYVMIQDTYSSLDLSQ